MKDVLWLNKETLEERYLDKFSVFPYHSSWIEVPEGATFATGDKDNFVFRKDGYYYDCGGWIPSDLTLGTVFEHEFIKLFWVRSGLNKLGLSKLGIKNPHDKILFTLERLLGCEVKFRSPFGLTVNGYVSKVRNSGLVHVTCDLFKGVVGAKDLTFFTEDGDELTFDEYVNMYYGESL